ncbi:MAG: HK97 family phage prohead protease, partial [Xanthomonas perforans]|nr:HK97 family phage prohead protease [Xanthomonas perforans]
PALAALVRSGAVAGLSVGYRPRVVHQGAARAILSAELLEISLVTVPMQPLARVIHILTKGE